MNESFGVSVIGHCIIKNARTDEILLDKYNSIHSQNLSRIIARGLAKEANYYIYRMAFGNGGAYTTATGQVVLRTPNDGTDGSGWESRLYNETYSEIVDETSTLVGTDPGSADANSVRIGGGSDPTDDPGTDNVVSQEVGTKSNVIVTCYLNENEPTGQLGSVTDQETFTASQDFTFNEIGLYSYGMQAIATSGYSSINVGNSTSSGFSILSPGASYTLAATIDGVARSVVVNVPTSGTGPLGQITYGDICDGINSGSWLGTGDKIQNYVYVFITDYSNGTYSTILNAQSYGLLTFQSKTVGTTSAVVLSCNSGVSTDFFNALVSGICGNINYTQGNGNNAGVRNDSINPDNERERLLRMLTFENLTKAADSSLQITYTLTVTVAPTQKSNTQVLTSTS